MVLIVNTSSNSVPRSRTQQWNRAHSFRGYQYALHDLRLQADRKRLVRDEAPIEDNGENDISSRFGRRLRQLRQDRCLTQTEMARRFGIDRSYISELERGRKSVSLPMLEILALGLKMSLSDLFNSI
ncbi:helix-turn-helix domain-containing protein [Silvibacterium bohemicum]|uniref:helix-turn-helix domain-containing protein n=1 Tax=Silvibacterium bohemicum TaxID=1577686 RepID=UPI0009E340F5